MRPTPIKGAALFAGLGMVFTLAACTDSSPDDVSPSAQTAKYETREVTDGTTAFVVVDNPGDGPTLSYGADSGVTLIDEVIDGSTYAFKDMNANGTLDTWEDWRLEADVRAADIAEDLTKEQIAGLMLFSSHEGSPGDGITDAQKTYLSESNLRNVLNAGPNDVDDNVTWSNQMQEYVESLASADEPYVPINFSSDPRSTAGSGGYNAEGADISRWPSNLGLAATFDAAYTQSFGEMASAEYRALGITTALSPQIDLATEPRWLRVGGTFGEDVDQASELAAAYVNGFQGTGGENVWGTESVNAMIKHFPSDGMGESGRESHQDGGKYAVYPGDNADEHLQPFLASINAAAVMTSYSIGIDANGDPMYSERKGTAYEGDAIDILRVDNGYEGVIVTDWMVTTAATDGAAPMGPTTAWGAEDLTVNERHYAILRAGVDMFGGNNDVVPVLAAYDLWQADYEAGKNDIDADTRFQESGKRILTATFQVGLYENAYLDIEESRSVVASDDKVAAGYEAQVASVVMLKNDAETISAAEAADWSDKTVYIPNTWSSTANMFTGETVFSEGPTIDAELAATYFGKVITDEAVLNADGTAVVEYVTPDLSDVDIVLVGMDSPEGGRGLADDGTYYPLSLQYRPYTADGDNVRKVSIAGDILADGTMENRSYFGATSHTTNEGDLDAFERAVAAVEASGKDIPVVTVLRAINAVIPTEFEANSDAILVGFGTSDQALIEVALGLYEPSGRLPIQFPANMDTVEAQLEDVAKDMTPYTDTVGNVYDYGFGLNYSGPIK